MPDERCRHMLSDELEKLLHWACGRAGQPPKPASVRIAELTPENHGGGRPRISLAKLRTPEEYEARFAELMGLGFAWINVHYCGMLLGQGLVTVEYPRTHGDGPRATSVNFGGPPKMVADASWDAAVYLDVTP